MDSQLVLRSPFNIETHKRTFINYLEVIISEDGVIMYAVPSHQEKLIEIACKKLNVSREQLADLCPPEYCFDYMDWLSQITNCIAVWNEMIAGVPNEKQKATLQVLSKEGLYQGIIG